MNITLPDGTTLDTSNGTPSKRSNKNRSGRAGVKAYRGRNWVRNVGGFNSFEEAVLAPCDYEMCKVAPTETTGWYPNGDPRRF